MKLKLNIIVFFLFVFQSIYSQIEQINIDVKPKLQIEENADLINISCLVENLTDGHKNLSYKFSLFKTDSKNNKNNNFQSGQFTLLSGEQKLLAISQINTNEVNKILILLLIYDENEKLIGSDKYNYIKNKKEVEEKNALNNDIVLLGFVSDETKTKIGKDFYEFFYSQYNSQKIKSSKIIVVEEEIAGRNTRIRVKIDYDVINEFLAKPDEEFLTAMAQETVGKVFVYLKNSEKNSKNLIRY